MSKSKEPSLRYQQFTEEWESRKLGELAESFEYGLNASAKKFDGSNKYIRITDIDDISNTFNQSGVTSPDIDFTNADNYKLKKGDILFARTGASVGKTYMYRESDGLVYYAGFLIRARIKSKISSEFIFQTTFTDSYNQFIKITSQRSGQPGINAEEYSNFKIMIPNYEEQNSIGRFFKKIDNIIALHQRKSNKLKQIKKSLMIQMFPKNGVDTPELRIGEYSDDWKIKQLGQLVEQVKSYSLSRDVETKDRTGFRYIHYGDIHTKVAGMIDSKSKLPNIEEGRYELLRKGDVVVADASEDYQGIATPAVITTELPYKLVAGLHTIALRPKKIDSVFLYYLIHSPAFREYGYRIGTGMKVFGISAKNLLNFEGKVPSIEEQADIGNFFKNLDETIAIHQEKYEKLKQIKTALLNDMFV